MKRSLWLAAVALALSAPAWALTVLQLNLEQLTGLSEKVFVGRCVDVAQEKDAKGRTVQKVTFDVLQTLKGEPEKQVTFRQLGFVESAAGLEAPTDVQIQSLDRDLPHYQVGEESIVFLSAVGGSGITAPVGLGQGKFTVSGTGASKTVVNGAGNRGLFIGADKSPKIKTLSLTSADKGLMKTNGQALPYDAFVSLVKKLATP
ncbi:MAG TPA: hypothetical protein VFX30_04510 [bacterium]|nr:hypothetical protein [bacterium]